MVLPRKPKTAKVIYKYRFIYNSSIATNHINRFIFIHQFHAIYFYYSIHHKDENYKKRALKNEVTIYSYSNHQWPNYK